MVRENATSTPVTHAYRANHMWNFKNILEFPKPSQLRVEEVKTLPVDGYRAMLNTGTLGGEGVPFFCFVSCSIAEKNIREWYFVSIKKKE
jgi:hypothetical protein